MIQNIRVGIAITGGQYWLGGVHYTISLVRAISKLSKKKRPQLYLVVQDNKLNEYSLFESILPYFQGIYYVGNRVFVAKEVIAQSFVHITDNDELLKHIDFYYPVRSQNQPQTQSSWWIPDFQDIHLPQYFTEQERNKRYQTYKYVAEKVRLATFSSLDARRDFYNLFPDTKTVTRVLNFHVLPEDEWYLGDPEAVQLQYDLPDQFLIVCNQFWAHKNHSALFKAIAGLRDRGVDLHLVCTGSTESVLQKDYFGQVRKLIVNLDVEHQIHILGVIPRSHQIQLMRRALAVIQPSLFEGWSTVVEDARALGKTIILSDLAVNYEQAPSHAAYFKRHSVDDLRRVIEQMLPTLAPGPDDCREAQAKHETQALIRAFAREFCSIVVESQFLFRRQTKGIDNKLWQLLTQPITLEQTSSRTDHDPANSETAPSIRSLPKPPLSELFTQADTALVQQNFPLARNILEQALLAHPDSAEARVALASIYMIQSEYVPAQRQLSQAIKIVPDDPEIHNQLAEAYFAGDKHQIAALSFKQALAIDATNFKARMGLAALAYHQRHHQAAAQHYLTALEQHPYEVEVWIAAGQLAREMGDLETASALLRRALALAPSCRDI